MTPWKFKITCSRPMWCVFCWKTFQLVTFPLVFCCRSCRSVPRFHSPRAVLAVDDRSKWSPWSHPRSSGRKKKGCFFLRQKKKHQVTHVSEKSSFWKDRILHDDFVGFFEARFSSKWLEEIGVPSIDVSLVKSHWPHHAMLSTSTDFSTIFLKNRVTFTVPWWFFSANPSASWTLSKWSAKLVWGARERDAHPDSKKMAKLFGHWFFKKMNLKLDEIGRCPPKREVIWACPRRQKNDGCHPNLPRWWVLSVTH